MGNRARGRKLAAGAASFNGSVGLGRGGGSRHLRHQFTKSRIAHVP